MAGHIVEGEGCDVGDARKVDEASARTWVLSRKSQGLSPALEMLNAFHLGEEQWAEGGRETSKQANLQELSATMMTGSHRLESRQTECEKAQQVQKLLES